MVQLEININWTTTDFTYNGTAQGKTGSVTGILTSQTVTFYVEKVGGDLALTPIAGNGALKITDLTSTDAGTYYAKLKIIDHNYVLASGDEVNWEIKKAQISFTSASGYVTNGTYNTHGKMLTGTFTQKDFTTDNIYGAGLDYGYRWNISGIYSGDSVYFQLTRYNKLLLPIQEMKLFQVLVHQTLN